MLKGHKKDKECMEHFLVDALGVGHNDAVHDPVVEEGILSIYSDSKNRSNVWLY